MTEQVEDATTNHCLEEQTWAEAGDKSKRISVGNWWKQWAVAGNQSLCNHLTVGNNKSGRMVAVWQSGQMTQQSTINGCGQGK